MNKIWPGLVLTLASNYVVADTNEISNLDLDSLLSTDVHITSAMRRTNIASETAASVYVITKEKIQNSRVTSVAEALTLAPGIQVRKIDNNKWAIGVRNPSGRYSSKLLVMVDGQSIYNPSFAGVYWEALKIPVYDIERIEIIRGQGGLLWGSNATSGVVNVITKHSIDSRTTRVELEAGTQLDHRINFRTGDDLDLARHSSYRIYGSFEESDKSSESTRWVARDSAEAHTLGGRVDIALSDETSILLQADYAQVEMGQTLGMPDFYTYEEVEVADTQKREHAQLMLRIDDQFSESSSQMLQVSASMQNGDQLYAMDQFRHYDFDYQINTLVGNKQIDFGINYRYNKTPYVESAYITSVNNIDSIEQYGAFIQAKIPLIDNELDLIVGNRSEHNSLTGWEHQPALRMAWSPSAENFFWGSISRGVRVPSLLEYDYQTMVKGVQLGDIFPTGIPLLDKQRLKTVLQGADTVKPERIVATELGYRYRQRNWNLDLSLFHSKSNNAIAAVPAVDPNAAATAFGLLSTGQISPLMGFLSNQSLDLNFVGNSEVRSYGTEIIFSSMLNSRINTEFGYSYAEYEQSNFGNSVLVVDGKTEQIFLAADLMLSSDQRIYSQIRWEDGSIYNTDSYTALDVTWHWDVNPSTSVHLAGRNLLEDSHLEYARTAELFEVPTLIDRSVSLGITVDF